MNKIAIICPYFGKLPKNYNYTFESMGNNSFIDWFVFTNDDVENPTYKNIRLVKMNFDDVRKIINKKIGTNINLVYKLCDYKPLYGIIFDNYLKPYDYWGYCDLDMIFGDLKKFITDDVLSKNDKIYDLGHFSIYKNRKELNRIYLDFNLFNIDIKKILSDDHIYVLDETYENHISINELIEKKGYKIYRNRTDFEDISILHKNLFVYNKGVKDYKTYYEFNKGILSRRSLNNKKIQENVAYVHFQKRDFNVIDNYKDGKCFYILPKKIGYSINKDDFYSKFDFRLLFYIKFRAKRFFKNKRK